MMQNSNTPLASIGIDKLHDVTNKTKRGSYEHMEEWSKT